MEPQPIEHRVRRRLCLAVVACAVVSGWLALFLLARVTPALFPGQALPLQTNLPSTLSVVNIESPGKESVFNRPIVVLLAAVDSRPGDNGNLAIVNTDSIMLVRLDPVAKDVRVLSVPRDLLVTVTYQDGIRDKGRVNSSFALGASNGKGSAAGMQNLLEDLEREFALEIDYWAQIDFRGAERLIDALGGITVDVPPELAIERWWYSNDDVTHRQLSLPAGPHLLSGYESVAFARLRAEDDDLHRIKRQQLVLKAAFSKAFEAGFAADPVAFWDGYSSTVRTNVPGSKMPGLALLASQTGGAISTYSLADPVDGVPAVEDRILPSGAAVLVGVPERITFWLDIVFGPASAANLRY